jgi:hypothetical protein
MTFDEGRLASQVGEYGDVAQVAGRMFNDVRRHDCTVQPARSWRKTSRDI